jgi:hypothetical protein
MEKAVRAGGDRAEPVTALGLLVLGLLSLCFAVLYPVRRVLEETSPLALVTGTAVTVPPETLAVAGGCLVIAVTATALGVLLLFLRL